MPRPLDPDGSNDARHLRDTGFPQAVEKNCLHHPHGSDSAPPFPPASPRGDENGRPSPRCLSLASWRPRHRSPRPEHARRSAKHSHLLRSLGAVTPKSHPLPRSAGRVGRVGRVGRLGRLCLQARPCHRPAHPLTAHSPRWFDLVRAKRWRAEPGTNLQLSPKVTPGGPLFPVPVSRACPRFSGSRSPFRRSRCPAPARRRSEVAPSGGA
jgi:hypothetical protein